MDKHIKLSENSQETKDLEQNPFNLKKVRDFVTRYTNSDNFPSIPLPDEEEMVPISHQTTAETTEKSIFSFVGDSAALNAEDDSAFPVIEFPSTKQKETDKSTAADHNQAKNSFAFATSGVSPSAISAPAGGVRNLEPPLLEPGMSVVEPSVERTTSSRPCSATSGEEGRLAVGQGEDFRIIDDDLLAIPSQSASMNMQEENEFYILGNDAAEAESLSLKALRQPVVGLSTKLRRRVKKTSLHLGRRPTVIAPRVEERTLRLDKHSLPPSLSMNVPLQPSCNTIANEDYSKQQSQSIAQARLSECTGPPHLKGGELDASLVSFVAPESLAAERYRSLRYLVEQMKKEKGHGYVVAVTSPTIGDGKTTTALNLAGSLAQDTEARILLIEADLHHPSVVDRLDPGSGSSYGLTDVVQRSDLKLAEAMIHYAQLNLTVLPATGEDLTAADDVLESPHIDELMEEACRQFDYIVVDASSLLLMPDRPALGKWIDGYFVVVAAHKTPRKLIQNALAIMKGEKVLGLVFNGDDSSDFSREKSCYN